MSTPTPSASTPQPAPPEGGTFSLSLPKRLGELMVDTGVITTKQLQEALEVQRSKGGKLGALLLQLGYIKEDQLLEFLGRQCGIEFVKLADRPIPDADIAAKIPENIARQHQLVPLEKVLDKAVGDEVLVIAVADPLNVLVLDDLKMITGMEIRPKLAFEKDILEMIEKAYGDKKTAKDVLEDILKASDAEEIDTKGVDIVSKEKEAEAAGEDILTLGKEGEDAPVIKMVNLIIQSAIKAHASDIHIEPFAKEVKVRYRIDGVLQEQPAPPKRFQNALVSRLKIMANLDIAERRVPQDGRIKLKISGKEYALRVSILPCAPGEKVVMRILDSSGLNVTLDQLGMDPEPLAIFQRCIRQPYGINLITGPTGSGKSTTLYTALNMLNEPGINISTVEDPVEYQLLGVNQVMVNNEVGLTFAAGLKAFLRQDPDIIMVGEIRDLETITTAINAALTGHLVFSTLHTNDAPGALTRMGMMGVEPFLISNALLMVVAQRLMRRICGECKETYEVEADWLLKVGIPKRMIPAGQAKVELKRGKGCEKCTGTGYKGRQGIYEILDVTDPIRTLIMEKATVIKIRDEARKQGMLSLRELAIRKVLAGVSTIDEMVRVTTGE